LETHPELNRLLALDHESLLVLSEQTFEALYCLDKEPVALALANRIKCPAKYGWGLAQDGVGTPGALQASAEYALALGVSDELKFFKNTKTYPEIIFEMAELDYRGEPYELRITPEDAAFPANFWGGEWPEVKEKVLVLVTGCGPKFPKKRWTESGFARLADWARENLGARVLLLAGPGEEGLNQSILAQCAHAHRDSRAQHSVRQAAALLAQSRLVVTGDTLALHLALAMGRKTIALFGPTCPAEIDLYGLGEKIVSKAPCAPCYRQCCSQSPDCMQSIALEEVRDAVRRLWS
jgi:heptosyltransferase-2